MESTTKANTSPRKRIKPERIPTRNLEKGGKTKNWKVRLRALFFKIEHATALCFEKCKIRLFSTYVHCVLNHFSLGGPAKIDLKCLDCDPPSKIQIPAQNRFILFLLTTYRTAPVSNALLSQHTVHRHRRLLENHLA